MNFAAGSRISACVSRCSISGARLAFGQVTGEPQSERLLRLRKLADDLIIYSNEPQSLPGKWPFRCWRERTRPEEDDTVCAQTNPHAQTSVYASPSRHRDLLGSSVAKLYCLTLGHGGRFGQSLIPHLSSLDLWPLGPARDPPCDGSSAPLVSLEKQPSVQARCPPNASHAVNPVIFRPASGT